MPQHMDLSESPSGVVTQKATTSPTSPSAGADPPSEEKRNTQSIRSGHFTVVNGEGCGEKLCTDFNRLLNKTPEQQHLKILEDLEKTLQNVAQQLDFSDAQPLPDAQPQPQSAVCSLAEPPPAPRASHPETQPFCSHWGCLSCA